MSALIASAIPKHYPKGWTTEFVSGNIAQFGARYRVAKAFKEVRFEEGMGSNTGNGYSKIFYAFLAYTAYEKFSKTFGLTAHKKQNEIEAKYTTENLYKTISDESKKCQKMLVFLKKESQTEPLKSNIDFLLSDKPYSIVLLGESIRHSFAHGNLTPSAWGAEPFHVSIFCSNIADFLIHIMDSESEKRLEGFKKKGEQKGQTQDI